MCLLLNRIVFFYIIFILVFIARRGTDNLGKPVCACVVEVTAARLEIISLVFSLYKNRNEYGNTLVTFFHSQNVKLYFTIECNECIPHL